MAIDGNLKTKWLDFNRAPLVLDYGQPVPATAYRFATANDGTDRDPVSWRLEGSQNGTTWELVDERASGSLEVAPRGTTQHTLVATNAQGSSFATASVIVNLLPRGSISASAADAEFHTAPDGSVLAGPLFSGFDILDVGRQSFGDEIRHVVIPFQLPSLGAGGFLRAEFEV